MPRVCCRSSIASHRPSPHTLPKCPYAEKLCCKCTFGGKLACMDKCLLGTYEFVPPGLCTQVYCGYECQDCHHRDMCLGMDSGANLLCRQVSLRLYYWTGSVPLACELS